MTVTVEYHPWKALAARPIISGIGYNDGITVMAILQEAIIPKTSSRPTQTRDFILCISFCLFI